MWWRDFQNGGDQAYLEQRLPLLYMVLPKHFKEKYSVAFQNLKDNVHRLVTAFDLHSTMKDLLNLDNISNKRLGKRTRQLGLSESRNISLFLPISATRTCEMAGISLINCACVTRHSMSVSDTFVIEATKSVVGFLNEKLSGYEQCSHLELTNITEVFVTGVRSHQGIGQGLIENVIKQRNERAVKRSHGDYFEIGINTSPGRGKYYVAVVVNGFDGEVSVDGIARVSIYGHDADCMPVLELRPYCYCKSQN
ncbi:unnamed protein product [Allacma fusca]|uniref:Uncharacterized protein n=1 Tax=Allacma fusca TaxID=39272 RepID=A0A8J2K3D7_9HEXA|nr:unnamed protein product [Allacma fusca]